MIQFERPFWLFLLIPAVLLTVWIGRRSLSGMATWTRRVALLVRLLVVTLLVMTIAQPQWRKQGKDVSVTIIQDASRSLQLPMAGQKESYLSISQRFIEANRDAHQHEKPSDRIGIVLAARDAYAALIPVAVGSPDDPDKRKIEFQDYGSPDATNLAGALRLAMAVSPGDAANRILLISDGNETVGSLQEAAAAAVAAHVPIDVLPITYVYDHEVIVDRLIAPATARQGENLSLKVVLTATKPADGLLSITVNGEAIDLDPASPALGAHIHLDAGSNVQVVPIKLPGIRGPVKFEAIFEPDKDAKGNPIGDTLQENNRAMAVTFVGGEGRVLVLASVPEQASQIVGALRDARIETIVKTPGEGPASLVELGAYECVVMVNTPAYDFSQQQQEELTSYVHDLGGGILMVGGDNSFGAGGWIGSPLADALPIKLDPPQKRQMPRGALVCVLHACEIPSGNNWGKKTAEAAIRALSAKDLAGIIEYQWNAGANGEGWVHKLSEVGDKSAILHDLNNMQQGDAPDLQSMLQPTYNALVGVSAGIKRVIVITDGDPSPPTKTLLDQYVAAKIAISTVAVFPHTYGNTSADLQRLKDIAKFTNGNYHEVTTQGALNSLPEIFIKEAQTVTRSLIWEGDPVRPALAFGGTEGMRDIRTVPPITGYIVAGDREGLSQVVLRGPENDPILAQWQYGLGRVVAYTSDGASKWNSQWLSWPQYRAFWEQHVRWAMRPAGNPNIRVLTTQNGETTQVVVEAVDDNGERLNFLRFNSRIIRPDLTAESLDLRQEGPGRYVGSFTTPQAGSYTLAMNYEQPVEGGQTKRGTIQAAVTRPFPDEFKALRDNAPLLEQVAKMTGGRVLDSQGRDTAVAGATGAADLWSRAGLTLPVSLLPKWDIFAFIAIGIFLLDVAIRRVRLDVLAAYAFVRRGFAKGQAAAGQQIVGLKEARAKAQAQMAERARAVGGTGGGVSEPLPTDTSASKGAKFEASAAELSQARSASAFADQALGGVGGKSAPIISKKDEPAKGAGEEQGMSALLKAKKRAQERMDDDQPKP